MGAQWFQGDPSRGRTSGAGSWLLIAWRVFRTHEAGPGHIASPTAQRAYMPMAFSISSQASSSGDGCICPPYLEDVLHQPRGSEPHQPSQADKINKEARAIPLSLPMTSSGFSRAGSIHPFSGSSSNRLSQLSKAPRIRSRAVQTLAPFAYIHTTAPLRLPGGLRFFFFSPLANDTLLNQTAVSPSEILNLNTPTSLQTYPPTLLLPSSSQAATNLPCWPEGSFWCLQKGLLMSLPEVSLGRLCGLPCRGQPAPLQQES